LTLCRPHLSDLSMRQGRRGIEELIGAGINKLILINGSAVFRFSDLEFIDELKNIDDSVAYTKDGNLVAAVLPFKKARDLAGDILSLHSKGRSKKIIEGSKRLSQVDILTFSYIWDPMLLNPELIKSDFDEHFKDKGSQDKMGDLFVYGRSEISVGKNLSADAASVIDAREGPVIIGQGVRIKPFTHLEGPAFIGDGCSLVGGKITGGCSFGSGCRIGGEVENSIFAANSNKYHEGFIGHAYIGQWVNLGALTTNSDLKNNYSEISVTQNGVLTKTGNIKIGCFIGDHTKTGIGTTLNTGAVLGFSCNLFGATLILEKEIPSFAWGNDSLRREIPLEDAVETARAVLARRNFKFDDKDRQLFEHIFNESATDRKLWIDRK
ncbi:MAG: hypothetical protein KKD66_26680, partial [Proteobacteria bacterium]|nr:hypothetical protein [Pseudomonadota bacterium]